MLHHPAPHNTTLTPVSGRRHARTALLTLAALLGLTLQLVAQGPPTGTPQPPSSGEDERRSKSDNVPIPFWQCVLKTGSFTVALKDISSVSRHEYVVDGVARVTEVNIGTSGSIIARFYHLAPISEDSPLNTVQIAQNRARDTMNSVSERVTGNSGAWENVVKNYPASTHAHTVEYRLGSAELAIEVFEDAEKAWTTGKGRKLTIE